MNLEPEIRAKVVQQIKERYPPERQESLLLALEKYESQLETQTREVPREPQ